MSVENGSSWKIKGMLSKLVLWLSDESSRVICEMC